MSFEMEDSVTQAFQKYNEVLSQESLIREDIQTAVRELEDDTRMISNIIQAIHHPTGILRVEEICSKCNILLKGTKSRIHNLTTKFDPLSYYKYHDLWRHTIQKLVFVVLFVEFITNNNKNNDNKNKNKQVTNVEKKISEDNNEIVNNSCDKTITVATSSLTNNINNINNNINNDKLMLMSHEECAGVLGLSVKKEEGFHLELEDYLSGLLMLSSELARLSTNAVTCGNYEWPLTIGGLVGKLDECFRLLNLKNDHLRRRYDVLKYDLKRVEEVAYDLSIRGLK